MSGWTRAGLAAGAVAAAAIACACGPSDGGPASDPPWFEERLGGSGVAFEHETGCDGTYWFPEISAGGVCLIDADQDGYLDLYLVQGGTIVPPGSTAVGNELYRNRGDWTFENVTATAGVGDTGYGSGCGVGDYDGDGDDDLYVTNLGADVLYRNNGDGTFTDVTEEAGTDNRAWGTSCAFLDIDGDEDLDLFVANYVSWDPSSEMACYSASTRDYCSPKNYRAPARDVLFRNRGDGTFSDATREAGLDQSFGNGFGIAHGDFDLDGDLDIYVTNDGMPNQLWVNQGDGRFQDTALLSGCAVNSHGWAEAGMGVAAVDVENDGDLDLFMCHIEEETNTFYLNQAGSFRDMTAMTGLATPSRGFTCFGMGFADFDHDGLVDLYVGNGAVKLRPQQLDPDDPYAEPNHLYRGRDGGRFEEVLPRGGTEVPLIRTSRAVAFGDLDNDGDVDLAVVNKDARPHLLENRAGDRRPWVMFRVRDRLGHDAIGAMVRMEAGTRAQVRQVQRTYSFCASNDPRVHFGLGDASRADAVIVTWPGGERETFGPFEAGRVHELRRGRGRPAE